MTREALLKVRALVKSFPAGDDAVTILHGVDIDIHAGEMIAIIGQSGSGKSTLMNILGCLDRPSDGNYWIDGKNTARLGRKERARLRREYIGFIFQRYHLIGDLNARENVCVPAVYAGIPAKERLERADFLLTRLSLGERITYKPNQLSGGQQQRVSIARALMNGGRIIFADEPTGALDSASGKEVMTILRELNTAGHTIILVTHDPQVAAAADRVIELKDGRIIADNRDKPPLTQTPMTDKPGNTERFTGTSVTCLLQMAMRAMLGHKLRAFLTMLGIIIGIASVVSMVALGQGAQKKVLAQISSLGSNTLRVFAGTASDLRFTDTLTAEDGKILAEQPFIDSATPEISGNIKMRIGNRTLSAKVTGIGAQYFRVKNIPIVEGRNLSATDLDQHSAFVYLDRKSAKRLFGGESPLGEVFLLGNIPVTVIGVVETEKQARFYDDNRVNLWIPYTALMSRLIGKDYLSVIILRIADSVDSATAEDAVTRILARRHGARDFTVINNDAIRATITESSRTLSLLIAAIAVIALIVGGIGVMNVMLVSVTERTQEIGIRMAVGARQSDIMRQFLLEAVFMCLIGGVLGIALAYALGYLATLSGSRFTMIYSVTSIILAFVCATGVGIVFGYLPARNAARFDPVQALANE